LRRTRLVAKSVGLGIHAHEHYHRSEAQRKRVTGIGGIFFQAKDPVALRAWYKGHLGIDVQERGGTAFTWADDAGNPTMGTTI
jgi:hypothetical protein